MSAFVLSNRNIIIPGPDGKTSVRLYRGVMGTVPGWAVRTAYFKALAADGKLVVSDSRKDKDLEKDQEGAGSRQDAADGAARDAADGGAPGSQTRQNGDPED